VGQLVLIRHAQTESNHSDVYMGSLDVPATEAALKLARVLGEELGGGPGFDRFVSSPLTRSTETMRAVLGSSSFEEDPRLAERSLGLWEGKSRSFIQRANPDAFLEGGALNPKFRFPEGEEFEPFCARVREFLISARDSPAASRTLVVTHNGWIRSARFLTAEITAPEIFVIGEPHLRPLSLDLDHILELA